MLQSNFRFRGLSLTQSFSEISENITVNNTLLKTKFFDYIFVVDGLGVTLTTVTYYAQSYRIQGHSGIPIPITAFRLPKAHMRFAMCEE